MGSRGCTQGFIGDWVGVQIRWLGRVHSPMNAPSLCDDGTFGNELKVNASEAFWCRLCLSQSAISSVELSV